MRKSGAEETKGLTRQRRAVLQVIRATDSHMTAAEVFEAARTALPGISYATVYNSLRHLRDAGLVREITFGNGASRYDRETARHDHALCTRCGKLVDFDLLPGEEYVRAAAYQSRFELESIYVTLLGVCPECRGTSEQARTM